MILHVRSVSNRNYVEGNRGISEIVVTLNSGSTIVYNVVSQLSMESFKHVHGAIDDASGYQFEDANGVLHITQAQDDDDDDEWDGSKEDEWLGQEVGE